MKGKLKKQRQALDDLWNQGLSGTSLLKDHSMMMDVFIRECFAGLEAPGLHEQVSIVALGGYGRQELFPFSDIDLMILFDSGFRAQVGPVADGMLYPLWDTGYEVGHGVRTVGESLKQAAEDYVFQVAMLDARLVAGSEELFARLLQSYRKEFLEGRRHDFIRKMNLFSEERRERFGSHGYMLEPNIKESKGGLRDIQSMVWAAKAVFGIDSVQGIVDAGFLLAQEGERFDEAHNMLVRIRNRLHYISGRKNDQLFFEQQEEMAAAFGYEGEDLGLRVERFMRDVYGHLRTIAVITDLFFDHVNEVIGISGKGTAAADREIEKCIELRKNRIHLVADNEQLQAKPYLLMRVFLAASRTGVPVHHRSKMTITENLGLVNFKLRSSPRMAKPFMAILLSGENALPMLEGMFETGLLGVYIPEFARIDSLAQHDVYHIYTVDRHSLQAVAELHAVVEEEPEISEVVTRKRPFFLAALLHDIGKNSGRDHSEYGSEIVKTVGQRLCLDQEELEDLSFLVRYHLFIPENALRRDLDDAAFITRCSETIGTRERLAMLYLLSIADSRATGPSAWSDWKSSLMREMYLKIDGYLAHSGEGDDPRVMVDRQFEEGAAWMRSQVKQLVIREEEQLRMDIKDLSADYLSSFTPGTILEHLRYHRDHYRMIRQKSLIVAEENPDHWSILVMAKDNPGLLAKICGVMMLNNLTVINAQIFTWKDGTVVDVIDVRPSDSVCFEDRDWQSLNEDLSKAVNHRLGLGYRLYEKLKYVGGRRRELVGSQEHRVVLDNVASDEYTVVEVHAADLPGQLYHITQALADFGINIHKAFIATEIGQLIDVFYVLDKNGKRIDDEEFRAEVENGLMYAIGATIDQN